MTEAKKGKQGVLKDSILSFSMKKEKKKQQTHKNLTKAKPVQCYWSYGSINKHQGSCRAGIFCGINQNWRCKKEASSTSSEMNSKLHAPPVASHPI